VEIMDPLTKEMITYLFQIDGNILSNNNKKPFSTISIRTYSKKGCEEGDHNKIGASGIQKLN